MAFRTLADLATDCITLLSQTPGLATQLYSSDRLRLYLGTAFDEFIDDAWWPGYMRWFTVALDGSTGTLTNDLMYAPIGSVTDLADVRIVFPENSSLPLKVLPSRVNPSALAGDAPRYLEADYTIPNRPFIVYPQTATGNLNVHARLSPKRPFTDTDVLRLPDGMLIYKAATMYATDDGSNPGAISMLDKETKLIWKQELARLTSASIELDPRVNEHTEQWQEI